MQDIIRDSATKLSAAIKNKEISCVELVSACIQQIEAVNPKLNAVVQFNPEKALQEAKEKDKLIAKNTILGPLHGIPFTLKDVYNTKGDIVTVGCLGLKDNVATDDATIVKRLRQAGAILLGKTNTPEFENAMDTDNLVYGKTSNPYNQAYSAGGSSGGSAAIVSACGSVFDVGADTGGSLRVPAHYNGITTIKPTLHRIPTTGVVYGLRTGIFAAFTTDGPLCRYVEDLPLLLSILQGPDGVDPNTISSPLNSMYDVNIAKLKIAYFDNNGIVDTSFATKQAVKASSDVLSDLGATVCATMPENLSSGYLIFKEVLGAYASKAFKEKLNQMKVTKVSPLLEKLINYLENFSCDLPTFMQRWEQWELYRSEILQFFNEYDVLIAPVTPDSALPHSTPMWDPEVIDYASYSWMINATILPVVVVRAGTSTTGLPIGIQIICKPFAEHIGLAVAQQIEKALGGWQLPDL